MHEITISEKGDHEFEGEWKKYIGGLGGREGKGENLQLYFNLKNPQPIPYFKVVQMLYKFRKW